MANDDDVCVDCGELLEECICDDYDNDDDYVYDGEEFDDDEEIDVDFEDEE